MERCVCAGGLEEGEDGFIFALEPIGLDEIGAFLSEAAGIAGRHEDIRSICRDLLAITEVAVGCLEVEEDRLIVSTVDEEFGAGRQGAVNLPCQGAEIAGAVDPGDGGGGIEKRGRSEDGARTEACKCEIEAEVPAAPEHRCDGEGKGGCSRGGYGLLPAKADDALAPVWQPADHDGGCGRRSEGREGKEAGCDLIRAVPCRERRTL